MIDIAAFPLFLPSSHISRRKAGPLDISAACRFYLFGLADDDGYGYGFIWG